MKFYIQELRRKMKYIVLDLEFVPIPKSMIMNQGIRLKAEIIQIGAVMMNENFKIIDRFMSYVKPQWGYIDATIKKLTGITPLNLVEAPNISDVLQDFSEWVPDEAVFVTWSTNDIDQIDDEMWYKNIDIPKLCQYFDTYIDCQSIFSDKLRTTKKYRLTDALNIAGLDYDDTNIHTALCDASNTALLFSRMNAPVLILSPYYVISDYQINCH